MVEAEPRTEIRLRFQLLLFGVTKKACAEWLSWDQKQEVERAFCPLQKSPPPSFLQAHKLCLASNPKKFLSLLIGSQTREAARSLRLLPWRIRSINRTPFSSSCLNISGGGETNRSAFGLLLVTQKWGLLRLRQDPHRSYPCSVSQRPWEIKGGRDSRLPHRVLTWVGEPAGSRRI